MNTTDEISTMMDLGLTKNQTKIYLTLIELGPSKAEEISKVSEITRQDIYRVMPTLQAMDLIEASLSRPRIFKALPLQETISTLFNHREKEIAELKERTRIMLQNHRNKTIKKFDEHYQVLYIPGRKALLNRTRKAIEKAKKSLNAVSSWNNVMEHVSYIRKNPEFKKMIRGAIEIRFVTEKPEEFKRKMSSLGRVFSRKPSNVKIRYSLSSPQAHVLLIDQKEIFIRMSHTGGFAQNPSIWSNNPCLIEIAKCYFEKMWNNSVDLDNSRKTQFNESKVRSH
jgi:sugar-specific transcriptional regulator TrmB